MASYRERHELFVSDLSGGPLWEIYSVSGLCLTGYIVWILLDNLSPSGAGYVADFVFNWVVPLAAITVYANKPSWLLFMLLVPASLGIYGVLNSKRKAVDQAAPSIPTNHRAFITAYRGCLLLLTAIAILAVDFPVFPRRFAKVETWGTSIMDLGVGSFVFSMGVVSARRSLRNSTNISIGAELIGSIQHSIKVLTLGIIRLLSVKGLGYQEHVTEYGVHWNFFMTLGLLPPIYTLLSRVPVPRGMIIKGALVALAYELVLKNTGLQEWVLSAERNSLLSANKEGLTSFWGYLATFIVGNGMGRRIIGESVPLSSALRQLTLCSIVSHALFFTFRIATEPSRRLANLPYVCWVISYNAGILACFAGVELIARRLGMTRLVSSSLKKINGHGQLVFLAANLLTGVINMVIKTIDLSLFPALAVLTAYACLLFGFVELLS